MKTLSSIFVVAIAVITMSCAGNANKPATTEETTPIEVVAPDSCCADSTCTGACDSTTCEKTAECKEHAK